MSLHEFGALVAVGNPPIAYFPSWAPSQALHAAFTAASLAMSCGRLSGRSSIQYLKV